jgi:hypothetical protein
MSSSGLYTFQGYSLVDITETGVTRSTDTDSIERNQQRNWETILQCISLRTQPQYITTPQIISGDADIFKFGEFYKGIQEVWTWSWAVEPNGIYEVGADPIGGLLQDFEQVPIITGLTETARFILPIFYPYGAIKNIYFKQTQHD